MSKRFQFLRTTLEVRTDIKLREILPEVVEDSRSTNREQSRGGVGSADTEEAFRLVKMVIQGHCRH